MTDPLPHQGKNSLTPARRFRDHSWPLRCAVLGFLFGILVLGLYLRSAHSPAWRVDRVISFVDADCYTRMTRVKNILEGGPWIQRFHSFENYPTGIQPHTTALFDGVILLVYAPLHFVTANALDWSGALVSPVLFTVLFAFAAWWFREFRRAPARIVFLVGLACLPSSLWATPFGRPDHQALLFVVSAIALMLESLRWDRPGKAWSLATGVLWGLALWISLFESALLVVLVIGGNVLFRRREQRTMLFALAGTALFALLIERWHVQGIALAARPYFWNWLGTIGEARRMPLFLAFLYFSGLLFFLPAACVRTIKAWRIEPTAALWGSLAVLLTIVALCQQRWFYYAGFAQLLAVTVWMDRYLSDARKWVVAGVFAASLFVSHSVMLASKMEEPGLTGEARSLRAAIQGPGAILAPWWISPSLTYYTGSPIVASSSHESLEGTVDSARFFTATTWTVADTILLQRKARWVVVYESDRVLENSKAILGKDAPVAAQKATIADRLWSMGVVPTRYRLRAATDHLRLYEFTGGAPVTGIQP